MSGNGIEENLGWEETQEAAPEPTKDNEFEIIRNAEPPKKAPFTKYPFNALEVGDAFFAPSENPAFKRSAIYSAAKRVAPDKKFSIFTVDGGVQVHRKA